jgi:ferredoxin
MRAYVAERADWLAGLMRLAQAGGELDPALSPDAPARLCLLLAMGSALLTPDLHVVDTEENAAVKVHVDSERCQGHGRCYDLTPGLFADDEEGYGQVIGDGVVPPGQEGQARLAAANCPERAIELVEEAGHDRC